MAPPRLDAPLSPQPAAGPRLLGRATALLALLVGLDLWSSHHLGVGLSQRPVWLGVVMASWTGAFSFLEKTLAAQREKALAQERDDALDRVRAVLGRVLLSTPLLTGLGIALLVVVLGYSSVTLVSAADIDADAVTLAPADLGHGESESGAVWRLGSDPPRFLVRSGPFGRSFRLAVPGYLTTIVSVPALTGLQLAPERDLRRTPTLLLRPPVVALLVLAQGGVIEVSDGSRVLVSEACACPHSLLLGGRGTLPADSLVRWQIELIGLRAVKADSPVLQQTLAAWLHPFRLAAGQRSLELPSDRPLSVRLWDRTRSREIAHSAEPIVLGDATFVDVLLEASP